MSALATDVWLSVGGRSAVQAFDLRARPLLIEASTEAPRTNQSGS